MPGSGMKITHISDYKSQCHSTFHLVHLLGSPSAHQKGLGFNQRLRLREEHRPPLPAVH